MNSESLMATSYSPPSGKHGNADALFPELARRIAVNIKVARAVFA
jgi:hypothetical protein